MMRSECAVIRIPNRRFTASSMWTKAMNHKEATEMTDWDTCPAVERTPGKVSGAWVFAGTRIPLFPCGRVRPASEND